MASDALSLVDYAALIVALPNEALGGAGRSLMWRTKGLDGRTKLSSIERVCGLQL